MPEAIIVVGLGFGDEGKGSIVDYLVRQKNAKLVVRYNGGSQAAHTVVAPSGQTHTFAQFGSGTFVPGVWTFLSGFMKVDPLNMVVENAALHALGVTDAFDRTVIDLNAMIVTPFQKIANRLRERARGETRHGSCGLGVGETEKDFLGGLAIYASDLLQPSLLRKRLHEMQRAKLAQIRQDGLETFLVGTEEAELTETAAVNHYAGRYHEFTKSGVQIRWWKERLADSTVIFEGAQGILLDQDVGFHPYTTWSDTTTRHAEFMLSGYPGKITKLGVTRAYMTRHGPGPFVTEDKTLHLPDSHNEFGEWQRDFRVGWPDTVMLDYAIRATHGIDAIAVTNLDRWERLDKHCISMIYEKDGYQVPTDLPRSLSEQEKLTQRLFLIQPLYTGINPEGLLRILPTILNTPIAITSYGPSATDKRDHAT